MDKILGIPTQRYIVWSNLHLSGILIKNFGLLTGGTSQEIESDDLPSHSGDNKTLSV